MSSINHLGGASGAGPVQRIVTNPIQKQIPADAPAQLPAKTADRLELSGVSHLLKTLKNNDVRTDKVAIIKAQIEAGAYDDEKKLDAAVDKLLDDLLK